MVSKNQGRYGGADDQLATRWQLQLLANDSVVVSAGHVLVDGVVAVDGCDAVGPGFGAGNAAVVVVVELECIAAAGLRLGLRRQTDVLRGVSERTRAGLTTAVRQEKMQAALRRVEERLE